MTAARTRLERVRASVGIAQLDPEGHADLEEQAMEAVRG